MLVKGWMNLKISHYGSPVLFVWEKTGELQMYIKFCALNAKIKLDGFLYL